MADETADPTLTAVLAEMLAAGATDDDLKALLKESNAPTGAAAAVDGMRSGLDGIRSLFAELVPPTSIVLTDQLGNEYKVGASASANAQIVLMREMEAILGSNEDAGKFRATYDKGGWQNVLHAMVQAMTDPKVLDALSEVFRASRPRTFVMARRAWIAEFADIRDEMGLPSDDALTAADLFPLEEIAAGLIPFFVRFADRMVGLVTGMVQEPAAKI